MHRSGSAHTGALSGVRVVEFAALGPAPYAAMLLADMGAEVVTVARPGSWKADSRLFVNRNRLVAEIDLKRDTERVHALIDNADMLIEGFRPGVMERLGLGPEPLMSRNPRLIYGRMTGWGQTGPLALQAGHDINFIAATGALDCIRGSDGVPVPPVNYLGDYGGGATFLVIGLLAALHEAGRSGRGQVVDAAMCDGVASLTTADWSRRATGRSEARVGRNTMDGAAPFYNVYECRDGRFLAIGASEPQFYAQLRARLGLTDRAFDAQHDREGWPALKERMADLLRSRTLAEWQAVFEGADACVTPVMAAAEAPHHPQLAARQTFVEHDGHLQPAPAPRFSRTPSAIRHSAKTAPVAIEALVQRWHSTD